MELNILIALAAANIIPAYISYRPETHRRTAAGPARHASFLVECKHEENYQAEAVLTRAGYRCMVGGCFSGGLVVLA